MSTANRHERTIKVIGEGAVAKLRESRIAVFGAGGVGGGVLEALVRGGAGGLDVFDGDELTESNLNRQLLATVDTVGVRKVKAAENRIAAINPECTVRALDMFVTLDNVGEIDFAEYDYVVDAIDNITAKIAIARRCSEVGTPIISCMGTGNKLDPTRFRISDISKTSVCPLAKVIRGKMRELGLPLNVLWSDEVPLCNARPPGSVSFVPPVAGFIIAGYVIKEIIK